MISVEQIVSAFRDIIGWPYASPGSNDENGIDCSGAFSRAYAMYGYSIYHGSNRIVREYCSDVSEFTGASQLVPGMAVLKYRTDLSQLSDQYKPGGAYYDPSLPYDYYHIGLVCSVNPLQIIHATTPAAKMDTDLSGGWRIAGYLNQVDYVGPGPTPTPVPKCAVTTAASGSTVNLRRSPSKQSTVLARVPLGETVAVNSAYDATWWNVSYQKYTGYMMSEFLRPVAGLWGGGSAMDLSEVGSPQENA